MDLSSTERPSTTLNQQPQEPVVRTSWVRRVRQRILRRRILMALALALGTWLFVQSLSNTAQQALAASLFANRTVIIALILFGVITLSLLWSAGQQLDASVFRFFNAREIKWLDRGMWLLTQLGNMGVALVVAGFLYLNGNQRLALELVLGLLTLWFVVETIKALADRARPFAMLKDVRIIGWRALGRSFPSGHTAQAFFVMSLFIHHFRFIPGVGIILYAVAALVGITRMYVGAHYPRDVIAGALLGLIWGIIGALVDPYLWMLPS